MIDIPRDQDPLLESLVEREERRQRVIKGSLNDDIEAEAAEVLFKRQQRGSLIAAGKTDGGGWNRRATAKRRAKNRVAARSRRKNRR